LAFRGCEPAQAFRLILWISCVDHRVGGAGSIFCGRRAKVGEVTRQAALHHSPPRRRWSLSVQLGRYSWRAYALPILAVLTIVAVIQPTGHGRASAAPPQPTTRAQNAFAAVHPVPSTPTAVRPSAPVAVVTDQADSMVCAANTKAKFVYVSISQQAAWMCQGAVQVNSSPVTTGDVSAGDATPTGSWIVQGKTTDTYLTGPGYRDYVNYWIPFDGDIGFHDATWQTMAFGSPGYTTQGSHGCVHLPMTVVTWLYAWAQTGSTVVTVAT
jgi:lipoprotein-anchoring transpeptidase ErfK/SrfK